MSLGNITERLTWIIDGSVHGEQRERGRERERERESVIDMEAGLLSCQPINIYKYYKLTR